mgnify:CR=1 FL=1
MALRCFALHRLCGDALAAATTRCQGDPSGEGWNTLRRTLGGEIPPPTPYERSETQSLQRVACEAAAAAAEARTRAMHEEATRDGNTVTAARASESAEQLRAAAELLGVNIDATAQLIRQAFLREALNTHPDRGGTDAAFTSLQDAHQSLTRITDESRQRAAKEIRDAREAASKARRHSAEAAEHTSALRLKDEIARAKAAAEREAKAAWTPVSRTVALHLQAANQGYMNLWMQYQRKVTRELNTQAQGVQGATYTTHACRSPYSRLSAMGRVVSPHCDVPKQCA